MMNIESTNTPALGNVLLCYSGRRLQFAIKLGILPTPERLRQVLNKKTQAIRRYPLSKMIGMTRYSQSS